METALLLWIHAHAHPLLDAVFGLSHELATRPFCIGLVASVMAGHALRRESRAVLVWALLGLAVAAVESGLKPLLSRARPQLWPRLVEPDGLAMPSGHALASAAFYPLLASVLARLHPAGARVYWTLGLLLPLYIGLGRLYLGLHWPSDVLVGWLLGGVLSALAVRRLAPRPRAPRL